MLHLGNHRSGNGDQGNESNSNTTEHNNDVNNNSSSNINSSNNTDNNKSNNNTNRNSHNNSNNESDNSGKLCQDAMNDEVKTEDCITLADSILGLGKSTIHEQRNGQCFASAVYNDKFFKTKLLLFPTETKQKLLFTECNTQGIVMASQWQ